MGPEPFPAPPEPLTRPRPGHADLAGGLKYDRHDLRDILERASARETAARVAVGAVCRKLLGALGVDVFAHVVAIGPVEAHPRRPLPRRAPRAVPRVGPGVRGRPRPSRRCAPPSWRRRTPGDTLGGTFEVVATGVPPGLGSHVQWDRKLDGRLAQALMSIHAIKGVEIGLGLRRGAGARLRGPRPHRLRRRRRARSRGRPTAPAGWRAASRTACPWSAGRR